MGPMVTTMTEAMLSRGAWKLVGPAVANERDRHFGNETTSETAGDHVPEDLALTPLLWLAAISTVLTAAGLVGLRRRDIGTG